MMIIVMIKNNNSQLFYVGEGNDTSESTSLLAKSSNNFLALSFSSNYGCRDQ